MSYMIHWNPLEPVMCECLVRLCHTVDVVFLLDGSSATGRRIEKFADEPVFHCLFAAVTRVGHDPADRQRVTPVTGDLEGYLISGTADTP